MHYVDEDSILVTCLLNPRKLRLIFTDPKIRPPVLEEMQHDIDRLAHSISSQRCDKTCAMLRVDDLVAECNLKLAQVLTKNKLDVLPNRYEAFKYIKTVFNNHCKGLVSKYRFTMKRGGHKYDADEPDEEKEISLNASQKNVDLNVDDPDQHMQLSDPKSGWKNENSLIEDVKPYLTPVELLLMQEFNMAGDRTRFYSDYDAMLDRSPGDAQLTIKFTDKNYADGLGLDLLQYKKILKSLREKIKWVTMSEATPNEIAWNQAIARLEAVFDVQIPRSIEKSVVRRLLTMASVDQFEKVENNEAVQTDLHFIGAKVPEKRAGTLSCFGIMYHKNNRSCAACGQATACKDDAFNFGLGDITIDSRLLGAKQYRVPAIVANSTEPVQITSARDEEIYNYLKEVYTMTQGISGWTFRHIDVGGIAVIVRATPAFEIKVIRPSESVQQKLIRNGMEWMVPPDMGATEVIELLAQHSHDCFIEATEEATD